jgi:hypothetical protein
MPSQHGLKNLLRERGSERICEAEQAISRLHQVVHFSAYVDTELPYTDSNGIGWPSSGTASNSIRKVP